MNQWNREFKEWLGRMAHDYDIPHEIPNVLHIGGHVGQEARLYTAASMLVTYCEPVPEFVAKIRETHLADNIFQVAVGPPGIKPMHLNGQESSLLKRRGAKNWDKINVLSVPLSVLQASKQFNTLVVDAQGATMQIMQSGDIKMFDWLVLEASEKPVYEGEYAMESIINYVGGQGFKKLDAIQHGEKDIYDLIFKRADL